jgi:hypothetical protein
MSGSSESQQAAQWRQSAALCRVFAENAISPLDRDLLLRMRRARLARADHQDFVDGLPPSPPANSNALAVPRR